jgi:hypothetical protein
MQKPPEGHPCTLKTPVQGAKVKIPSGRRIFAQPESSLFCLFTYDGFSKTQEVQFSVIPAQAGIQSFH